MKFFAEISKCSLPWATELSVTRIDTQFLSEILSHLINAFKILFGKPERKRVLGRRALIRVYIVKAVGFGGCGHGNEPEGCTQYWECLGKLRKCSVTCSSWGPNAEHLCVDLSQTVSVYELVMSWCNHHDDLEFPKPSRWLPVPKIDDFKSSDPISFQGWHFNRIIMEDKTQLCEYALLPYKCAAYNFLYEQMILPSKTTVLCLGTSDFGPHFIGSFCFISIWCRG
jgi:hypothetical protein